MPRKNNSPYRYDRAAIRLVLETEGRDAALARWPRGIVDPIARILGMVGPYKNRCAWNAEWNRLLGTKPDSIIAGELGIPPETVRRQRWMLGIPTANRQKWCAMRRATLRAIPDDELMAGTLDGLARKYQTQPMRLAAERKRRGLDLSPRQGLRRKAREITAPELRRVAALAIREAYPGVMLEQIAGVLGCTRERIRQIFYLHDAAFEAVAS